MRTPCLFVLLVSSLVIVSGFTTPYNQRCSVVRRHQHVTRVLNDDKAIECFFVFDEDAEKEGILPDVVCTSQPDEYAWFNGIERENLKPTEGATYEFATECVEGASPRGFPEWECKAKEESSWQ